MRNGIRWSVALLIALTIVQPTQAQDWWVGVRGGPSIPQLSGGGNEVSRGYSSILAPNFGLVVERTFTTHFSILAEVDYSGQGGERKGLQPITQDIPGLPPLPPGTYYYGDFKNRSELDYLEIPVLAKYEWALSDNWRLFVEAGPYIGYLMHAEEKTRGTSLIYTDNQGLNVAQLGGVDLPPVDFSQNTNVRGSLNKVNAGAMAGAGLGYLLDACNMIYLDIRGEYGLTTIQKNTSQDGRSNTGSAAFLVGYKHCFGGG